MSNSIFQDRLDYLIWITSTTQSFLSNLVLFNTKLNLVYIFILMYIFIQPPLRLGWDTMKVFKWNKDSSNLEFSFSLAGRRTKANEESAQIFSIAERGGRKTNRFMPFPLKA